ncbi:MAG: Mu transposase C-terminal domain-containing protein [Bacteroidota bacterium]
MMKLEVNQKVYFQNKEYKISKIKDIERLYISDVNTNEILLVNSCDLKERLPDSQTTTDPYERPLESYSKEKLAKAKWRLGIIQPFLGQLRGNKQMLIQVAQANNLNVSTLFNWISKFDQYGHIGCLVDSDYKGGKGKGRLPLDLEEHIRAIIEENYLESKKVSTTYSALVSRLQDLEIKVPHVNTLRRRIKQISEKERMSRRLGKRTAEQKFDPKVGKTPYANTPLSLVQIDHTQLDIMLVDEVNRKPFKRPWITVVIDCFSRMVLGFYISFDAPSAFGVGRAIANAVLRKEKFLKSLGLEDLRWPCWGKMSTIYTDNGKEFRGSMLKESCANYKITLKWGPVKKPEYGGIIERYMGTIAQELKDLPGCTKVSSELRAMFKPEKTAAFTLSEFEKWFTIWLTEVYHKREHKGIGNMLPIEKWNEGIMGGPNQFPIGLPEVITDENRLRLDLLPQYKRTVQRTGVHIEKFQYYSGVLSRWINACDETARGKVKPKRQFVFKFDPRDISSIMFLNPDDNQYHEVQSVLNIRPHKMSIWDHRRACEELRKNKKKVDQASIFATYKRLKALEEESKQKTKHAQKKSERESRMDKGDKLVIQNGNGTRSEKKLDFSLPKHEIKPYEELEFNTRRSFK